MIMSWPYSAVPPETLFRKAAEARLRAYAPYSRFPVGAALLAEDGHTVLTGCNVENGSFGLSLCAERNAVTAMIAAGFRRPFAVAVVGERGRPCFPCGACRQFLAEFNSGMLVLLENDEAAGGSMTLSMEDLLPHPFLFSGEEER